MQRTLQRGLKVPEACAGSAECGVLERTIDHALHLLSSLSPEGERGVNQATVGRPPLTTRSLAAASAATEPAACASPGAHVGGWGRLSPSWGVAAALVAASCGGSSLTWTRGSHHHQRQQRREDGGGEPFT